MPGDRVFKKGVLNMEKFKRSAFLIVMGTAILLFMSGCGMKKRAAGMSGETLTKKTEASATKTVGVLPGLGFQPGLPPQPSLRGFPKVGDSGEGKMAASVAPEQPSLPTVFPEGDRDPAFVFSPELPPQSRRLPEGTMARNSFDPGPTGYEGVDFTRGLSSMDFLPELPPQPNLAGGQSQELFREETMMAEAEKFAQEGKLQGNGYAMALLDDFFEFDRWRLTNEAKRALEANAKWIKANPSQNLIIEGHCDERGAESYNVELGMKRANATRNYLIDLGVDSSRIKTVSYGESRPFCVEKNEDCYQKNRRAHFVVAS